MAQDNINYSKRIEQILDKLPDFIKDYIYNFGGSNAYNTKFEYCKDICDFMQFMVSFIPEYSEKNISDITPSDIENVSVLNLNRYFTLLLGNDLKPNTVKRRRATLSSMYSYFISTGVISKNPVAATHPIKVPSHKVLYLTIDEQKKFLEAVRTGLGLSDKALSLHPKYVERDLALFILLLDTGLRVSEMLFTDIIDYDLDSGSVIVKRKGGDIDEVFYSDECASFLSDYFSSQMIKFGCQDKHFPAFTTLTGERLGVRATEMLVKKYIEVSFPEKSEFMSPHKLRSSFAMAFYEASGKNILLLQERMHHKSITTTNIYAKSSSKEAADSRNLLQNIRS